MSKPSGRIEPGARRPDDLALLESLQRAARALAGAVDRALREVGLTAQQLAILEALADGRPCRAGDLERRLASLHGALAAPLGRLVKERLITRERGAEDRRIVHLQITAPGRERAHRGAPLRAEALAWALRDFEAGEREWLAASCRRIA